VHLQVECDASRGIEGDFPSSIVKLEKLEFFSLKFSTVTGELPVALGEMTSLRHFELFDSFVKGEIPVSACKLEALQNLILVLNSLTGIGFI
jgi:hypothetical protein